MKNYNWNPVFEMIMEIKKDYKNKVGVISDYNLETWLAELNNEKYNEFFSCLQLNHHNGEMLIRYGIADMQQSMWTDEDSMYRECRSLVIDLVNNEIIAAPFRKFFNLSETEATNEKIIREKIENCKKLEITDKKDGSMQFARYYRGQIKLYGSMALAPENSWRLKDGYSKITFNIEKMIKENESFTFIFEYISLADQHVVHYTKEQEGLYLLGIRDVYTGREFHYFEVEEIAKIYNVPMIEIQNKTFNQILEEMKVLQSDKCEGWVLNIIPQDNLQDKIVNSIRIKLKCDSYVALHRMLDKISSVNVIIKNVSDNTFDDLFSKIPDNYKDRVQKIAIQVYEYIKKINLQIDEYYFMAPKIDRKEFMLWVEANVPKDIRGYLKNKYLCKSYHPIKKSNGGYKLAKEIRIVIDE